MTEASRLSTTAHALELALTALGNALAKTSLDAIAEGEMVIDARVREFRDAATEAASFGETLAPEELLAVNAALARCRRLGSSLTLLTRQSATSSDAPRAYTPVGQPLSRRDGGSFLTARG